MVALIVLFLCSGCVGELQVDDEIGQELDHERSQSWMEEDVQLTLWSFYDSGWEYSIADFTKRYSNVSIEVESFPYDSYADTYLQALLYGNVPDIMVFESTHFSKFIDLEGLENLAEPPYTLTEYEQDIDESFRAIGQSFNEQKIYGLTISASPIVTFYRPDILESFGYPTEPEALAEYMADPEQWLEMARTLKQDGRWMMQWVTEIVDLTAKDIGLFDQEMNFIRMDQDIKEVIELAKVIQQEGLSPGYNLYESNGQDALRDDRFAMFYQGSWGEYQIGDIAPEQEGKWKATRLPLDVYALDSSTILAIPSASENKQAAWAFMEYVAFEHSMHGTYGVVPSYIPAQEVPETLEQQSEILGGQQVQRLYLDIMENIEMPRLTPIDEQAERIWHDYLGQGVAWDIDSEEIMEEIRMRVEDELSREISILRRHANLD
ncbi:extracellular solute-binding protein [Halalkalibacter hemicellulosilyticusJCM 9152]|uniref:Extracellular solute-binding protein n=2 Tax=Halalkalibacter TaxID=2893056 RepID=W4QCG0_9BACI|nr:extracellular solute-binding protein [Halalkalibacter hemicellulosilyticusJCM 9152]